ncbi:thiol-disulfide oxidoreductase DCC family protein [Gimesia aquarii]|uniref:Thiol-disulfide oxidoreductase n=1 Tax=Gimesia aquarii TaxID=2527964 RepID=A0A517WWR8_9PLAN|nr:DUF393 domain-containing protein [Gimesia aquarii]QDU09717.1 hypothetical protein V202x_31090 [Gimesia aquarii]
MNHKFEIEAFYDGACPLCRREINMIHRLDKQNKILFTDISDSSLDIQSLGKSYDQLMSEMHARLPDGRWITGVEVFRRLYTVIGFRYLVLPTRLPVISQSLDFIYRIFAKKRLSMTGRCNNGNSACQTTYQKNEVEI